MNNEFKPAVALHVVWGLNPLHRLEGVRRLVQQFAQCKKTLMLSTEVFNLMPIAAQNALLQEDETLRQTGTHVMRLAPGCLCCSSKLVLSTHLARTLRLNPPEVLVLELESQSHPDQVLELLNQPKWRSWFSSITPIHLGNPP